MAYACSYEVPGTQAIYEQVKAEIGDQRPDGLVVHLVMKSSGGLRHVGVWDSQEDWERFRNERVQPAVRKVLTAAGFQQLPPPPVEESLPVVDVMIGG